MRAKAFRAIAVATVGLLVACAGLAYATASPAPPNLGAWRLEPIGSANGLKSGGFTVVKHRIVTDLHAKLRSIDGCAGGSATVRGALKMKVVTVGDGIREWSVASGRNPSGGLSAIPVDLMIDGHRQVDATLTIGFPTKGQRGAGELNWGTPEGGIPPCVNAYYVVAG